MPAAKLRPVGPRITARPPVMYSQPWSPTPSTTAVVEGVGDHGCEYMTGGRAVILGPTGRNFAAGMSGGFAFVWDPDSSLYRRINHEMVDLDVLDEEDVDWLRGVITLHMEMTGSEIAERILSKWWSNVERFTKIFPKDFK